MKITFVVTKLDMSGGIKVIALYAERLQRMGHEVVVVAAGAPPEPLRRRARVLLRERRWLSYQHVGQPSHFDGTGVEVRTLGRYRPVTDRDVPDADVVVATWWETAPWVAKLSPRKGAKAYFMQDYGAPGMELEKLIPTWKLPLHIITIAEWLVELVTEHGGRQPISLVLNSVETEHFHAPERGKQPVPTFGFCYREVPVKGYETVLEAFELARRELPELRMVSFGPEPPTRSLPPGFEFHLRPATEALGRLYGGCDAWIFASRREGFGLPILEAMACRTPVIGTPAGAAPELIARGGGLSVRHDDPADMARAMLEVARMDEARWKEMSARAYDTVQGYTWDDAAARFERALHRAVELSP
jgi:glycosyltransferase involved in cell wall biosynthesis